MACNHPKETQIKDMSDEDLLTTLMDYAAIAKKDDLLVHLRDALSREVARRLAAAEWLAEAASALEAALRRILESYAIDLAQPEPLMGMTKIAQDKVHIALAAWRGGEEE